MFVGRERELGEVDHVLDDLARGAGGLVLIAGEPGIGKTRLASEALHRAHARGVRVAWGHCWEAGGAPAMWPWREALQALGAAFPERIVGTDSSARFALFTEVASALPAAGPCAIVLEDLHAADIASVLLLEFVAARLRSLPVCVIGTYRELEASLQVELSGALGRSSRHGLVLQPGRLGEADVGVLVREAIAHADEALIASVYRTTLGNPLFVGEVIRDARVGADRAGHVPLGVREVIRQRLALVPPETRQVLEAAAVLGVELAVADLARLETTAAATVDDAARSGLVIVREDRARFAHALYREALYHELPRPRRCELHRDAARALAARGASLSEVAHHLLEAGEPDAIETAIRAAYQALAMFAFEDAVRLLERARAAVPPGDREAELRCRVTIALGEVQLRSGNPNGRALCAEAGRIARELDNAELLARAGIAYGSVFVMAAVDPVLVGMLEEALVGLGPRTPLRAQVMARLASARQPSVPAERPRDIQLAFDAMELAREVCEPPELLEVLHSASGVLYGAAEPPIRLPIMREVERLADELGDVTRVMQARVRLAMDHLELGDFAAHARAATAHERLAERYGAAAGPWRVPLMRSMQAILAGDHARSEALQAEASALAFEQPRARRAIAMHRICFLHASERHADLRAALPELRGMWLDFPYGKYLADARVLAELAWLGAEDEARALMAELPEVVFEEQINAASIGDALWLVPDRERARQVRPLLHMERWRLYWFDCEIVQAPMRRVAGYAAAILGNWDECEQLFGSALRDVEARGIHALAARMRFELGDLMLRLDRDPERARRLVAEGRVGAAALGLTELVALIDRRHPAPRAESQSARPRFALALEGEYYTVAGGARGAFQLKASRGLQYLAQLVERPNEEIHVLDLVGSGDADRGDAGEVVDATALRAYRERIDDLREAVDRAEMLGDTERAALAREEMEALAAEIARSTSLGGRPRRTDSAADRARTAVQRRIKDAIDRIEAHDPTLGGWLRRAVRTGKTCSYVPQA